MVEYFSPAEDRIFAAARTRLEAFVRGRAGYEPKVKFDLRASGGSQLRLQLTAAPLYESVPVIYYRQWIADLYGFGTCTLTIGDNPPSQQKFDFQEPPPALEDRLHAWLSRELPT